MVIETGIYCIINVHNNKVYVGGAYKSLRKRWDAHRSNLRCGTHHNKHLQAAWDKYGEDWFLFDIIERCGPSTKEISDRETYWIGALNATNPNIGYNVISSGVTGIDRSIEIVAELTHDADGRPMSPGGYVLADPVDLQDNLDNLSPGGFRFILTTPG